MRIGGKDARYLSRGQSLSNFVVEIQFLRECELRLSVLCPTASGGAFSCAGWYNQGHEGQVETFASQLASLAAMADGSGSIGFIAVA